MKNPEFTLDRAYQAGINTVHKSAKINSVMTMSWNEPLFSGLDKYLLTQKGWFPRPPETPQDTADAASRGRSCLCPITSSCPTMWRKRWN